MKDFFKFIGSMILDEIAKDPFAFFAFLICTPFVISAIILFVRVVDFLQNMLTI